MRVTPKLAAAIAAAVLLAQPLPAAAQSGGYAQACRYIHGRVVCSGATPSASGATGSHAYERWSNGSPAIGGSTAPDTYRFPQYLGGHNAWYGFGR